MRWTHDGRTIARQRPSGCDGILLAVGAISHRFFDSLLNPRRLSVNATQTDPTTFTPWAPNGVALTSELRDHLPTSVTRDALAGGRIGATRLLL